MTTFVFRLQAPRPTFAVDMTDEEREIMGQHAAYWQPYLDSHQMVVFGPVLDDTGSWGLGVVEAEDEHELQLDGFLVFLDPPKLDAADALQRLANLGIAVKVVTGDNAAVAVKVCGDLGLVDGAAMSGADIDALDDTQLAAAIRARHLKSLRLSPIRIRRSNRHGIVRPAARLCIDRAGALRPEPR